MKLHSENQRYSAVYSTYQNAIQNTHALSQAQCQI